MKFSTSFPNIPKKFKVMTKAGECFVNTQPESDMSGLYKISINNKWEKELASESIQIDKVNNSIYGVNMIANPEYQRKGYGFGEILRLTSVADMVKNGFKSIEILSKNTAVLFHKKYKFVPDIHDVYRTKAILEDFIENPDSVYNPFRNSAKRALLSGDVEAVNDVIGFYLSTIERMGLNTDKYKLQTAIPMILKEDVVSKNAEFFNSLYKKHGIDFEI